MKTSENGLHLYEEILLLALRDKEGSLHFGIHYQFALAGALVAELLLTHKITIETDRRRKFVVLVDGSPTGDEVLDACLDKLNASKRRQQVQNWVRRFSAIPRLKHRAASSLVKKHILKLEEDHVLFLFKRKIYPEIDPRPEKRILDRMYDAIFSDKREVDPHTLVLIAISESTGLLKANFDKKRLRERRSRIKQIVNGDLVGKATKDAVEAMQAAVMVATIIPAVTVAATAGH